MAWRETLIVAYAADDNYAKYLGISMLSLFQNNVGFQEIRVFVLDCGIGQENLKKLKEIVGQFEREIVFLPVQEMVAQLDLNMRAHKIAVASYARLFLSSILPSYVERVLYLDCDTLVCAPLRELWETELGDSLIAGVQDTVDKYFLHVIGLGSCIAYTNNGVLLINLKLWREENLEKVFMDFIDRFDGTVPHHDQGVINGVSGERRVILPLRFNVMSNIYAFSVRTIRKMYFLDSYYTQIERDEALAEPAIIHFTPGLYGRPWEEDCHHPAKEDFLRVLRQSPWGEEPLSPGSLKPSVKLFAFFYNHMPLWLFEMIYRAFSWVLHLRK